MSGNIYGVQTFLADVSGLLEEENYRKIYDVMPDFRREKADRLRNTQDKAQSVGAWYLWMRVQEMPGIRAEDVVFNLSHSGNYVLCSAASGGWKVGCDIETVKEFREPMARRFFCPEEYAYIMAQDEAGRREAFYRYWVLKESFMKATRRGMGLGLNSFSIQLGEEPAQAAEQKEAEGRSSGASSVLVRQPEEIPESYYFKEYSVSGARVAVCSTSADFSEEIRVISLAE